MWTKYVFLFPIFILFYLFPFNFIDAKERDANLNKIIKSWILVIFRTCIIHKLSASCLRLSFHLTFKFLVLQTKHQFFLFLFLSVKQKFKVDAPMQIFPLWSPKILPPNLVCFSKHLDILTSWLFLVLVTSLLNIVVMFIERN